MTYHEPFGPIAVRPQGEDCPDCQCCTRVLCEKARQAPAILRSCQMYSHDADLVRGCPCPTRDTAQPTS